MQGPRPIGGAPEPRDLGRPVEKPEGTAASSSLEVSVLPGQLRVLWLRFTVTVAQLVLCVRVRGRAIDVRH